MIFFPHRPRDCAEPSFKNKKRGSLPRLVPMQAEMGTHGIANKNPRLGGDFCLLYHMDLDIHSGGQVQIRKGFHDAGIGIQYLHQPLMNPELKLLA
jgi:hypothetical protein